MWGGEGLAVVRSLEPGCNKGETGFDLPLNLKASVSSFFLLRGLFLLPLFNKVCGPGDGSRELVLRMLLMILGDGSGCPGGDIC